MISIITINRNNAAGLQKTIESVVSQSYAAVDFIVIDGDSTDGSKALLTTFKDKLSLALSEPDTGIYNAMNKGIRFAKGDYLLFLNSGDYLLNNEVLASMAPHLHSDDVISGDIMIEDEKGVVHRCVSQDKITLNLFSGMSLYHQATFISKKAFDTYGLYNESFKLGGDYEFFIRLFFKNNATYRHVNQFISYFISNGISNDARYLELNKTESKEAWELNLSKITLAVLAEQQEFEKSTVYWLYLKTRSSVVYKSIFSFLYALRYRLSRLLRK